VRQWIVFCRHADWDPLLISSEDFLPLSISKRRDIEFRLCCFAAWLRRAEPPLASGTVAGYVGHVRSRHSLWMLDGTAFAELVGSTRRLALMLRALKKQRPPAKRKKKKFHIHLIQKWYSANFDLVHSASASFESTRDLLVMVFSFYQLCRLSELTNTSPPSQANANPVLRSDLRFFSSDHKQLEEPHPTTPQWWRRVAYIRCRSRAAGTRRPKLTLSASTPTSSSPSRTRRRTACRHSRSSASSSSSTPSRAAKRL
jgi:hypothetical protein